MANLIALLENVIDNLEYCANYSDAAIVNKQEIILNQCRKLAEAAQELREAEPFGYLDMSSNDDPRQCSYFTTGPVTDHPGWIPLYRHPTRK